MTVKSILIAVCQLLGKDDTLIVDGNTVEEKLLLRCLNMIVREIAEEYVELKRTLDVSVENGEFELGRLGEDVCAVKKIEVNGVRCAFSVDGQKVYPSVTSGTARVTFSYYPAELQISDRVGLPSNVSQRALVYGTASEYCLMKEMYEECVNLNSRYVRAISAAVRPRREIRVKKRGWL